MCAIEQNFLTADHIFQKLSGLKRNHCRKWYAMFPARILIIEVGAVLAENLKTFLGRRATDIRIDPDTETAMEILQSFVPDLRVLDYNLSGINMLRAYKNITSPSTRIVM
jgi:PleD family two-component response regulator